MKIALFFLALIASPVLSAPQRDDLYLDEQPSLQSMTEGEQREFWWLRLLPLIGSVLSPLLTPSDPAQQRQFVDNEDFLDEKSQEVTEHDRQFFKIFKFLGRVIKTIFRRPDVVMDVAHTVYQGIPQDQYQGQAARRFADEHLSDYLDTDNQMSPEESRQFLGEIIGKLRDIAGVLFEEVIGIKPAWIN